MKKKIGYFFYSLTPAIACIGLMLCIQIAFILVCSISYMADIDGNNPDAIVQAIMQGTMIAAAPSVFCYHIVGIIVFGLWYYFGCKRPKPASPKIFANVKFWGSAVLGALVFISLNYVVIYFMSVCFPKVIQSYVQSMEMVQLSNATLMYIATIFLAPVGEELLMRGLTLNIAQKCTKHFWVANVIQAFLFGVIHMNFVQGTYAFLGGLLLGWLYKKYNSLYITILVHFLVNLSASTWAGPVFGQIPDNIKWWLLLAAGVVAALLGLLAWNGEFRKREKNSEELLAG